MAKIEIHDTVSSITEVDSSADIKGSEAVAISAAATSVTGVTGHENTVEVASSNQYVIASSPDFVDNGSTPRWLASKIESTVGDLNLAGSVASLKGVINNIASGVNTSIASAKTAISDSNARIDTVQSNTEAALAQNLTLINTKTSLSEAIAATTAVTSSQFDTFNSNAESWFLTNVSSQATAISTATSNVETLQSDYTVLDGEHTATAAAITDMYTYTGIDPVTGELSASTGHLINLTASTDDLTVRLTKEEGVSAGTYMYDPLIDLDGPTVGMRRTFVDADTGETLNQVYMGEFFSSGLNDKYPGWLDDKQLNSQVAIDDSNTARVTYTFPSTDEPVERVASPELLEGDVGGPAPAVEALTFNIGDIWIVTDYWYTVDDSIYTMTKPSTAIGNRVKKWDGSAWVDIPYSVKDVSRTLAWAGSASKFVTNPNTGAVTGWGFADNEDAISKFVIQAGEFELLNPDGSQTPLRITMPEDGHATMEFHGSVNIDGMVTVGTDDSLIPVAINKLITNSVGDGSFVDDVAVNTYIADNFIVANRGDSYFDSTIEATKFLNSGTGMGMVWKAADGVAGKSVYTATIYKQSATLPTAPSDGTYNFDTGILTPPTGWVTTQPEVSSIPIYACDFTFKTLTTGVDVIGPEDPDTWTGLRIVAVNGITGSNINIIFTRSVTQPDTITATTPTVADWYDTVALIPASTAQLWSSVGKEDGGSGIWAWGEPMRQEGAPGESFAEVSVYIKSATPPTPLGSTGSYSFETNLATVDGWYNSIAEIPESTDPIYVSQVTANALAGATDLDLTWSDPILFTQSGTSMIAIKLYNTTSAPDPGELTYTFSSGTFTTLPANNWTTTQPDSTTTPTYMTEGLFSATAGELTAVNSTWTPNVIVAQNGAQGDPGIQGDPGAKGDKGDIGDTGPTGASSDIVFTRNINTPATPTGTFTSPGTGWVSNVGEIRVQHPMDITGTDLNETMNEAVYFNDTTGSTPANGYYSLTSRTPTPGVATTLHINPDPAVAAEKALVNSLSKGERIVIHDSSSQWAIFDITESITESNGVYSFTLMCLEGNSTIYDAYIGRYKAAPIWGSNGTYDGSTYTWGAPRELNIAGSVKDPIISEVVLYQRNTTSVTPTVSTYNLDTGSFVTKDSTWFTTIPATGTDPVYMAVGLAVGRDIVEVTWNTPTIMAQNGVTPIKGINYFDGQGKVTVSIFRVYQNATVDTTWETLPSDGTYTGATVTVTDWSDAIPAYNPSTHFVVISTGTFTANLGANGEADGTWSFNDDWSIPKKYTPEKGVDFWDGDGNFVDYIFGTSTTTTVPTTPYPTSSTTTNVTPSVTYTTAWKDNPGDLGKNIDIDQIYVRKAVWTFVASSYAVSPATGSWNLVPSAAEKWNTLAPVQIELSHPEIPIPVNSYNVIDYTAVPPYSIKVFRGSTQLGYAATLTPANDSFYIVSETVVDGSIVVDTSQSPVLVDGTYVAEYSTVPSAFTTDTATVKYVIRVNNGDGTFQDVDTFQMFTKTKQGINGSSSDIQFSRKSTKPPKPSGEPNTSAGWESEIGNVSLLHPTGDPVLTSFIYENYSYVYTSSTAPNSG